MKRIILGLALGCGLLAGQAQAKDTAVIISNFDYTYLPDIQEVKQLQGFHTAFENAGYETILGVNQNFFETVLTLRKAETDLQVGDKLLVFLAGHFTTVGNDSYLLSAPLGQSDRFSASASGVALNAILGFAGEHPEKAIVIAASPKPGMYQPTKSVSQLPVATSIPEGVTFVHGEPLPAARFSQSIIKSARNRLSPQEAAQTFGVEIDGFMPEGFFGSSPVRATSAEEELWGFVTQIDSETAYETYLSQYPNGLFADEARAKLYATRVTPEQKALENEQKLNLSRGQRRQVQDNLTTLGYNTRGVDGLFGRGTRRAILKWQTENGFSNYGFLTEEQIEIISLQSDDKRRQLEKEANERKAQQKANDEAFWRTTGRGRTEAGLNAYLERYPNGLYSEIAKERLAVLAPPKPAGPSQAEISRDQSEEGQIVGNPIARLLVEKGLHKVGFNPGKQDGVFDGTTRAAIRLFQTRENLPATGYVGRTTFSKLLAAQ